MLRRSQTLEERQRTLELLYALRVSCDRVIQQLEQTDIAASDLHRLKHRWNCTILGERSENTSLLGVTIDKGKEVRLCLRDQDDNIESFNSILYVMLHELAHVMSKTLGHGGEFETNMERIVKAAVDSNVYEPKGGALVTHCESIIPLAK